MLTTDAPKLVNPLDEGVWWKLSLHHPVEGDQAWAYDVTHDAWDSYEALIDALERDGYIREGIEAVRYGRSAMQTLIRDCTIVTVHLVKSSLDESAP